MRAMPIFNSIIVLGLLTLGIGGLHGQEDQTRSLRDWPMYGRDLRHTFSNQHSLINPTNVRTLKPAWDFMTGDVVSASPAVVDGVVFVGSWDGYFYAIDVSEGSLIWKFQVDCQNTVIPIPPQCLAPNQVPPDRSLSDGGIITSSAAVVDDRVYFAAGKTVYSLNADGSLRWKTVICGNPDKPGCAMDAADPNRIFSSPAILGNNLFIGHTADGADGYRGGIEALNIETGKIRWRFEVDPILDTRGKPLLGPDGHVRAYNRGCGNVWSSAAVDVAARLVFLAPQIATINRPRLTITPSSRSRRIPGECDGSFDRNHRIPAITISAPRPISSTFLVRIIWGSAARTARITYWSAAPTIPGDS